MTRILIVDDDPAACRMLQQGLARDGVETRTCSDGTAALEHIAAEPFDVVLTDLNMRGLSGIDLCERVVASYPNLPVIVLTAFGSLDTAIQAIRAGAYDFITKPFDLDAVEIAVERAVRHRELREEVKRLRAAVREAQGFGDLLGSSPAMTKLYSLLTRVAATDATVLISGESGTGKEVVARALHERGTRSSRPFVAVNCAALPEPLLESELFGHVRGAFTDAKSARSGLFVEATGGTLFLDEVGDMPLGLQPKLLRALEQRTVRPVGGSKEVPFDIRVIAATNRDLETAMEQGRFREDLYYRLNVITISLPPLRSRGADILVLAQYFIDTLAAKAQKAVKELASPAAERLMKYTWPGNVRELRNCIERAVALTSFEQISVDDLPEKIRDYQSRHVLIAGDDPSELVPLEQVERRYILKVFEAAGNNKSLAAQILGLDRKTLYRKLAAYGVGDGPGIDVTVR